MLVGRPLGEPLEMFHVLVLRAPCLRDITASRLQSGTHGLGERLLICSAATAIPNDGHEPHGSIRHKVG